jgi:hypothetical protein
MYNSSSLLGDAFLDLCAKVALVSLLSNLGIVAQLVDEFHPFWWMLQCVMACVVPSRGFCFQYCGFEGFVIFDFLKKNLTIFFEFTL